MLLPRHVSIIRSSSGDRQWCTVASGLLTAIAVSWISNHELLLLDLTIKTSWTSSDRQQQARSSRFECHLRRCCGCGCDWGCGGSRFEDCSSADVCCASLACARLGTLFSIGSYQVLSRKDKTLRLLVCGKAITVSGDRVRPAYIFNENLPQASPGIS
jgi:hypothetical protein